MSFSFTFNVKQTSRAPSENIVSPLSVILQLFTEGLFSPQIVAGDLIKAWKGQVSLLQCSDAEGIVDFRKDLRTK